MKNKNLRLLPFWLFKIFNFWKFLISTLAFKKRIFIRNFRMDCLSHNSCKVQVDNNFNENAKIAVDSQDTKEDTDANEYLIEIKQEGINRKDELPVIGSVQLDLGSVPDVDVENEFLLRRIKSEPDSDISHIMINIPNGANGNAKFEIDSKYIKKEIEGNECVMKIKQEEFNITDEAFVNSEEENNLEKGAPLLGRIKIELGCSGISHIIDNNLNDNDMFGIDLKYDKEGIKENTFLMEIKQEEINIKDELPLNPNVQSDLENVKGVDSLNRNIVTHTGEKQFACNLCKFKSDYKCSLNRHMIIIHAEDKPFACNLCKFRTAWKIILNHHMKIHTVEKPFACTICKFKTVHKFTLKLHVRRHTGEKPFLCNLCDYGAYLKFNLNRHMAIHTGEKQYVCNLCDFNTYTKDHLNRHKRMHTGERSYVCNICDFNTYRKDHLDHHMKTHTGEKNFACNLCEFKTSTKGRLIPHMKTHTGEKNFVCNLCEFKTTKKVYLNRHAKIHTGEK